MVKVIIFNGPPRSGKDTCARLLTHMIQNCFIQKFSDPLKYGAHALYGLHTKNKDHYEANKDEPRDEFFGKTAREIYIALSETYLKVHHGKEVFGELFVKALQQKLASYTPTASDLGMPTVVAISDCGFLYELLPVIKFARPENCCLVRLYRPGCNFAKDSREYINAAAPELRDISFAQIQNNASKRFLKVQLGHILLMMKIPAY